MSLQIEHVSKQDGPGLAARPASAKKEEDKDGVQEDRGSSDRAGTGLAGLNEDLRTT